MKRKLDVETEPHYSWEDTFWDVYVIGRDGRRWKANGYCMYRWSAWLHGRRLAKIIERGDPNEIRERFVA